MHVAASVHLLIPVLSRWQNRRVCDFIGRRKGVHTTWTELSIAVQARKDDERHWPEVLSRMRWLCCHVSMFQVVSAQLGTAFIGGHSPLHQQPLQGLSLGEHTPVGSVPLG